MRRVLIVVVGASAVVATVMGVGMHGGKTGSRSVGLVPAANTSGPPGPSNTQSNDQRYASQLSRRGGIVRVSPASASSSPRVSQGQAYSAFIASGMFPKTASSHRPDVRYGLFSDDEYGTLDGSGGVTPSFENVPAWIVRFDNVPDELCGNVGGTGDPRAAGTQAPSTNDSCSQPAPADILVVYNANTGAYMLAIDDGASVAG